MDVTEAITWRRSVRSYAARPVEEWKLRRVLDAARLAPSGRNRQIWRFIVVGEADRRRRLAELCNRQEWMAQAPIIIAGAALERGATMGSGRPAHRVDLAIALDHLILAATELGLGTCWIGAFDGPEVERFLEVPEEAEVVALVTLGYPAERWRPRTPKRLPLDEVVFDERWGERIQRRGKS